MIRSNRSYIRLSASSICFNSYSKRFDSSFIESRNFSVNFFLLGSRQSWRMFTLFTPVNISVFFYRATYLVRFFTHRSRIFRAGAIQEQTLPIHRCSCQRSLNLSNIRKHSIYSKIFNGDLTTETLEYLNFDKSLHIPQAKKVNVYAVVNGVSSEWQAYEN